jgi:hypothetical protein
MPTTAHGLPYPNPTIPPNVPVDLQSLAEAIDAWLPKQASPAASFTLTPNSTTMQDVPGMSVVLGVGTWVIDVYVSYNGPAAADIKIGSLFSGGLGAASIKHCVGPALGTTDVTANATMRASTHNSTTAVPYGHDGTATNGAIHEAHRLVASASGTFKIQAAQNTANAGNMQFGASSFIKAIRVA